MKISIDIGNAKIPEKEESEAKRCFFTLKRFLVLVITLFMIVVTLYFCKRYIKGILYWLENQDSVIISSTIIVLFIIVSFPLSVGYIVVVGAAGYLFGILKGFLISVIGANIGLFIAHNVLRLVGHHQRVRKLIENETATAILRVISGPLCFKIVLMARLTPIPFGFQNTIFALSNVNGKIYHLASCIGLFAGQFMGVYVGSTLRSMQDVLDNRQFSTGTYVFAGLQLVLAAGLIVWCGAKARSELLRALNEAESKLPISEKPPVGFNIV
ncbi:transmembrane protein 64 [Holotrichia oblita]|uniref:Transmembrane protein 64 n=1 Tax=Holotrichia oblita TaxID=644536 RepID=A0ACB9SNN4_HOLOL|nr:transmembrane protein 64 [Holotrichia oblita]